MTRLHRLHRLLAPAAAAALLGACDRPHHILNPASPDAVEIERLWWILFGVSLFVLVAVVVGWAIALFRRRSSEGPYEAEGNALRWILVAGALVPAAILAWLTAVTIMAGARISMAAEDPDAMVVQVVGHQFWWEVHYPDAEVTTANEIHLPAGRAARLRLNSNDVIHSIWIPRLHGKLDLTPGRTTEMVLRPGEPGVYRGFCAEFCGVQHALMGLLVVVQPPDEFQAWLEQQARPVAPPADLERIRGLASFVRHDCHLCHRVRGGGVQEAGQDVGPDLTHLRTRRTLGSATIENTTENLAAWILNPHAIKPGVLMPATPLPPDELAAIVRYLEGLQ
jgi:cytochrome c oxidase subunit II